MLTLLLLDDAASWASVSARATALSVRHKMRRKDDERVAWDVRWLDPTTRRFNRTSRLAFDPMATAEENTRFRARGHVSWLR
jgi:hypothetical protein